VAGVLLQHLHQPDLQAARILYSAVAAHRLKGTPVWPMVVAPPGSAKTVLVEALEGLPGMNVHLIDTVTPQTFISGQIPDPQQTSRKPASLLLRIGEKGIIVAPDFSTVLSGNADKRTSIFSDLRRIYDGQLRKEFGTASDDPHEWKGRLTFVAAVTPAVDSYTSVFQSLGERFLMIRWPRANGVEAAEAAMHQDTGRAKSELRAALGELFGNLPEVEPKLPPDMSRMIAALSEFTVRARTHVHRSNYGAKEIESPPEPESPTRLSQQLAQLAKGSALLDGRDTVNDDDYRLVQRAAMDCIPPVRRKVVDALLGGAALQALKIPRSTLKYAREDLEALELMDGSALSETARDLLEQAGYPLPEATRPSRSLHFPPHDQQDTASVA
jgi:hypothetical protein